MKFLSKIWSSLTGLNLNPLVGDPSPLVNGDVWYNDTTHKFRRYQNGVAGDFGDQSLLPTVPSTYVLYSDGTNIPQGTYGLTFDATTGEFSIVNADYIGSVIFRGYSSVGSLKSGAGFMMGTGVKPDPVNDNAVVKTTSDNGHMFYTRYDRGVEIHTGLTGSAGTSISDSTNLRFSINGAGSTYFSTLGSGLVKSTSGVISNATAGSDYQAPLGFTPENVANKATDFSVSNDTLYPTVKAVKDEITKSVVGQIEYTIPSNGITTIQIDASNITLSDSTVATNTSGISLIKKQFFMVREGFVQYSADFSYNSTTGIVTPTTAYNSGERLLFIVVNTIP